MSALAPITIERRLALLWARRELSFLLRHAASHMMDHAWEMEDMDLSGKVAA